MRIVALGTALAGGVCLVATLFVDASPLSWAGLTLLAVAVAVVGAGLVRTWWLALIAGVGSVALAGAVLAVLRDLAPDRQLYVVVGGVATLCVAVALLRPPHPGAVTLRPGNHRS